MPTILSDQEFIRLWQEHKSPSKVAEVTGFAVRAIHKRRRSIEKNHNVVLGTSDPRSAQYEALISHHKARITKHLTDGVVLVESDQHFWPGPATTMHRAFVKMVKELKPAMVVSNGDAFDGVRLNRHGRIGFLEKQPTVKEQIEVCQERHAEIEDAAKGAVKVWCLGNHDINFERSLSSRSPEYEGLRGFHLKDWFPAWLPCWGVHLNPDEPSHTVFKHRWHGGLHATHNNALKSGVNMVTGHLHSPNVRPWSDYTGTRYGVDAGTTAEPYSEQFVHYTEDNPVNWRPSFAVLTYHKGRLLMPQLAQKWDEHSFEFGGKVYQI